MKGVFLINVMSALKKTIIICVHVKKQQKLKQVYIILIPFVTSYTLILVVKVQLVSSSSN